MYNKIRDTLAATVAHVGGSLPINIPKPISATLGSTPLSSEYEIGKQVFSALHRVFILFTSIYCFLVRLEVRDHIVYGEFTMPLNVPQDKRCPFYKVVIRSVFTNIFCTLNLMIILASTLLKS